MDQGDQTKFQENDVLGGQLGNLSPEAIESFMQEALSEAQRRVKVHKKEEVRGFKAQGKSPEAAIRLLKDAQALEEAGAFAIVLETVPAQRDQHGTRRPVGDDG